MTFCRLLVITSFITVLPSCSSDAEPRLHDPEMGLVALANSATTDGSLFKHYNPGGPVKWSQEWVWKLDLTGVAWDLDTTVTAITPRHVVMAAHFPRSKGQQVGFHDRKGRFHRREIEAVVTLSEVGQPGDVSIGLLDRALPTSIRTYPLLSLDPSAAAALVGAPVLVTDQDRRVFIHRIARITGNGISFRFDAELDLARRKNLVVGDSGNPAFVLTRGELALIETHSTGGAGAGPFYGSQQIATAVDRAVAKLDSAYQIRRVSPDQNLFTEAQSQRLHEGASN